MDRYITRNSLYIIDLTKRQYYRLPLTEGGRSLWEKLSITENMVDGVWLDLEDLDEPVRLIPDGFGEEVLQIRYKGSQFGLLTSPIVSKKVESSEQSIV